MKRKPNSTHKHFPGDELRLSPEERTRLLEKERLYDFEAEALLRDDQGALLKIGFAIASNLPDREHSATATHSLILPRLKEYVRSGGNHRLTQQGIATRDRSPLTPVLREYVKYHPYDMSDDAWDALPAYSDDDITISIEDDLLQVEFHPADPQSRRKSREFKVTRGAFRAAFSRAKRRPKTR
jgi:hypothetical protein